MLRREWSSWIKRWRRNRQGREPRSLAERTQFSITSRVMRVFDSLNSKSHQPEPGKRLPPATGNGFMDWAQFVGTEFHGIPPVRAGISWVVRHGSALLADCYNFSPRANHVEPGQSCAAAAQRKRWSATESRATGSSVGGSGQSRWITNRRRRSSALFQEADNHVSRSARENRRSATGALGEVESS